MDRPTLSGLARGAPILGEAEERELIARAQRGDTGARDRIVLAHTRLAVAAVRRFKRFPVPVDDLVQDAVCGLLMALDRFDAAQPVRFGTYAVWWIRAEAGSGAFRMAGPVSVQASNKVARAAYYGGELASVSMDEPIGEGLTRADAMVDAAERPDEATERALDEDVRRALLDGAMARLTERERTIVAARHRAEDGAEATLEDLGRRFGLSKERIRQIEAKALEKLREMLAGRRQDLVAA